MKTPALLVLLCLVVACKPPPVDVMPDAGEHVDAGARADAGTPGMRCLTEPDCASVVAFSTRLEVAPSRLNAVRMKVCHGVRCAIARPVLTSSSSASLPSAACVTEPGLSCALSRRADGAFNVSLALTLASDVVPADGDTVSLDVRDGAAAPLVHVERQVQFERLEPATECACRIASQFVLPSSASGLTCSTKPCESGARLSGAATFTGSEQTARLCRGTACATASLSWGDTASFAEGAFDEPLAGATVQLTRAGFEVSAPAAPDELHDGDRYTLEVGGVTVLDKTPAYALSTPNGAACDVQACRTARQ